MSITTAPLLNIGRREFLADAAGIIVDALDYLAPLDAGFADLGFEWLDPAMAERLASWASHFLIFSNLDQLTAEITRVLNTSNHALVFENLKYLDVEAAGFLVKGNNPLELHGLAGLSLPLAEILSIHEHELSLSVQSLEPLIAQALSGHRGYYLHVVSRLPYSDNSLRAFSDDAMKHLNVYSGKLGNNLIWKATEQWWVRKTALASREA